MTSDLDIYRAAKLIMDQHGDEAALYATNRADQLLDEGDTLGSAIWRRIAGALEEVQRSRPRHPVDFDFSLLESGKIAGAGSWLAPVPGRQALQKKRSETDLEWNPTDPTVVHRPSLE
jgi:hypothetical protein